MALAFIEVQWRVETCNSLILDVLNLIYHLDIQERCQVNTWMVRGEVLARDRDLSSVIV